MASVLVRAVASFPDGPGSSNQRAVDDCLRGLSQALTPDEANTTTRHLVVSELTKLVEECIPGVSITAYGSSAQGLSMAGSDIDIAIHGFIDSEQLYCPHVETGRQQGNLLFLEHLDRVQQAAALALVQSLLSDESNGKQVYHNIELKDKARVPLLKFTHAATGIAVDIVCGMRGQLLKSHTISQLCQAAPMLAPLYRLVKLWARLHDLNDATDSTFNSWSLLLMVIFSLQTLHPSPHLPPLWKAFLDQLPVATEPRPLQVAACNTPLQRQYMQRCEAWLAKHTSGPAATISRWNLLDCLHWFMVLFSTLMQEWQTEGGRSLRASVWMGRLVSQPYEKQFRVLVEEPFDCHDNTARSLGEWDADRKYPNRLPYVSHVFNTSERLLRSARLPTSVTSDGRVAFLWLFGCQGLSLLPPTLTIGPDTLGCTMDLVREARRLNAAAAAVTSNSATSRYMSSQQLALKEALRWLMTTCGGPDCPIGLQWIEAESMKKLTAEFAATMQEEDCEEPFDDDVAEIYEDYDAGEGCWELTAEGTEFQDQNLPQPHHELEGYYTDHVPISNEDAGLPETLYDDEHAAHSALQYCDGDYGHDEAQHQSNMHDCDGDWYTAGTSIAAHAEQDVWLEEQHLPGIHCGSATAYQHETQTQYQASTYHMHHPQDAHGYTQLRRQPYSQSGQWHVPAQVHGVCYPRSEGEASEDGLQAHPDEEEEEQWEEEQQGEDAPAHDEQEVGLLQQQELHQLIRGAPAYHSSPLTTSHASVLDMGHADVYARQTYAYASSPYSSHSVRSVPPTLHPPLTCHTDMGRLGDISGGTYNKSSMSEWQYARTSCSTPGTAPAGQWIEPVGPSHSLVINSPASEHSNLIAAAVITPPAASMPTTHRSPTNTAAAAMKAAVALLIAQPEGVRSSGGNSVGGSVQPAVTPLSKLSAAAQPWSPVSMPSNHIDVQDVSKICQLHQQLQQQDTTDNPITMPGRACQHEPSTVSIAHRDDATSHVITCQPAETASCITPQECIQQ